ncbi:MAG: hypothetical protein K1X67_20480 [Fimbriimonadaceae bacterium]|nr:hypothetical protein [Fimbriimonadaceae bacterium]
MEDLFARLRSNQLLLNVVAGTLGGAVGAGFAEVVNYLTPEYVDKFELVVFTATWFALLTSIIAASLFAAGVWHQRRDLRPQTVLKALIGGAVAGFIAGGIAQWLYQQDIGSVRFQNYVLRTFCWGLAGALIGAILSRTVPNLSPKRGSLAGFAGGVVGGIGFLIVSNFFPDVFGRLVGVATLGAALGLAMYLAENLFREASLEVIWAPNESSRVGLGSQPVTIGGGEDHIFVRALPPRVSTITFQNGLIEHIETSNGRRTRLEDGSRLRIGPINLLVHAAK